MNYKTILIGIISLLVIFTLSSCEQGESKNEEAAIKDTEKSSTDKGIPVEALVIRKQTVRQNVPLTGVLKPLHSVDIVAEVSGKITKVYKKLGDRITTNDILAIIDDKIPDSNYKQAKAQVFSAENNLNIAKLNRKSDEELFKSGDISKLAYDQSDLTVKTAEANHLSALANLSLTQKAYEDTRLKSPISGLISRKHIELGTMINPNMPVYRVVDLSTLKIEVGLSQDLISRVRLNNAAKIKVSALSLQTFDGYVEYISPQADENTGTFSVEIHVKNTKELTIRAGMTAKIDLILTELDEQLVVPDYALVTKNGNNFVYKIKEDVAQLIEIEIAETIGSNVVVACGLVEGDSVVVVGMNNLGTETKVFIETVH